MKHNICISICGIVLGIFACVATGFEVCDEYWHGYTYCDDGYYCCYDGYYCCYGSSGSISGDSSDYGSSDADSSDQDSSIVVSSSSGLSVAAIVGIVIGSIVGIAVVVTICAALIHGCSKTSQDENVITPVRAAPVQMISTGETPYILTHPPPNSHTLYTSEAAYSQSFPGAVTTRDTER